VRFVIYGCVYVGFVVCGCVYVWFFMSCYVYVWVLYSVGVCKFGFCNVCVYICVGFVMCFV